MVLVSQFLRELHFIEAGRLSRCPRTCRCRSSFGNCTSLRLGACHPGGEVEVSQFLRELHFIEAVSAQGVRTRKTGRSSFGNCTSLRPRREPPVPP